MRKSVFILIYLLFIFIPKIHAQQPYNHNALELLKRSLEYLIHGDFQNALAASNQLIRIDPNSALNYVIRARALFELNDYDSVITDCTQAIRIDRNNSAAFVIRGNAYVQKNDITRAISDWEAALRINPNIHEAIQNIELARKLHSN